ncbi:MAG: ATP-binding cassette domain-containing protein [Planctomycetota bacterium]
MALLTVKDLVLSFGEGNLIDRISFSLDRRERICLLGRNGTGKSTLLKLIHEDVEADEGQITLLPEARIGYLPQVVPAEIEGTVFEVVEAGITGDLEPWVRRERAERVIAQLDLPGSSFRPLSAGLQRRVLLARAWANDPDLLLLDEPTNHMDMAAILALEKRLLRFDGAILFVTHDRDFLTRLSTRIMELDRGKLTDWACDYPTFLERKLAHLEAESTRRDLFDRKLEEEETWIRQGLKARRKRNMGRVRRLQAMREEKRERLEIPETPQIEIANAGRTGVRVIEAKGARFGYEGRTVVREVTTRIYRKDRIGVVGPNGCGKTTLLRGLLKEIEPLAGSVRLGTGLRVVYFDQLRDSLDPDGTVLDNVADGNDILTFNGRDIHAKGYLHRFLFSAKRVRRKVRSLSGGEQNRLLLAKLFAKPSNVLVMDEPTNDLDIETLELLEDQIDGYPGTLLLVSHDRAFLENVVTSTFVYQGDGVFREVAGGFTAELAQEPKKEKRVKKAPPPPPKQSGPRKLTYKEKEELKRLPARIEALEERHGEICRAMADPDYFKGRKEEIVSAKAELLAIEKDLAQSFSRWEELEERDG